MMSLVEGCCKDQLSCSARLGRDAEFRSPPWIVINIAADHQMFMTFTGELSWQRLRGSAVDFYSKNRNKSLFEPPFRWLRGNVRTPSMARWKARGQLYIFRYLLRLRRNERKSVEVGVFRRGWVTLNADFRVKGASPTNHSWYQSSRVIALSCCIKVSAVRHLVLSQCTRVTDGQTDGRTYGQTDRISTPKTALAYARAVTM